ncbi:hypothetical protein WA171_005256 [Blastocystis sp. BT1]
MSNAEVKKVILLYPIDHYQKITALLKAKKYKEVVDTCDIERMKGKNSLFVAYSTGVAYFSLENYAKAKTAFESALNYDAEHMNSLRYLSEIGIRMDDSKLTKLYLSKIIAKEKRDQSPDLVRDYKKLLKVYDSEGNSKEVVAILQEILFIPDLSHENRDGALLKYSEYLVITRN